MSDISQIQVNGTTYDLCDATSRTQIANLQDSVNQTPTEVNGTNIDAWYINLGKLVVVWLEFKPQSASGFLTISPMPQAFRPSGGGFVVRDGTSGGKSTVEWYTQYNWMQIVWSELTVTHRYQGVATYFID